MHRTPLQVRDYPKTRSCNDLIMCWLHSVMSFLISASPTFHRARRRLLILIFRSKKVTSVPRGNHRRKLHTTAVLLISCQYSWPKISVMDLEVMKRKWLIAEIAVCVSKSKTHLSMWTQTLPATQTRFHASLFYEMCQNKEVYNSCQSVSSPIYLIGSYLASTLVKCQHFNN